MSHVFCHTIGKKAGQRITADGFAKAWQQEAACSKTRPIATREAPRFCIEVLALSKDEAQRMTKRDRRPLG